MLSAPHIMPAMIVVSFPAGLTAPDLTRVLGSSTCSPINRERPVCSASSSTGTKPPADTRFRSSNTADSVLNLCDDCTGNAFPNTGHYDSDNRYCPSSEGIFAVHTPIKQPAHPRIKAKIRVVGERLDAADGEAIVRMEVGGTERSRIMLFENGNWVMEPTQGFAAHLGEPVEQIVAEEKAAGLCSN